jgi:hypothetical protein
MKLGVDWLEKNSLVFTRRKQKDPRKYLIIDGFWVWSNCPSVTIELLCNKAWIRWKVKSTELSWGILLESTYLEDQEWCANIIIIIIEYLRVIKINYFRKKVVLMPFCIPVIWRTQVSIQGMQWSSWLRQCTSTRQVTALISVGVVRIFHWRNPSGPFHDPWDRLSV